MSEEIQVYYICSKVPSKAFIIKISKTTTIKEFLEIISSIQKDPYLYLFYEGSIIDNEDLIIDYITIDPEYVFYASTTLDPPTEIYTKTEPIITTKRDESKSSEIEPNTNTNASSKDKYLFFFTGSTKDHLMKGIEVELYSSMNPNECSAKLEEYLLNEKMNMDDKKLIIYLAGGIPFIGGTLGNLYNVEELKAKKVIYGVLTRTISDNILNKEFIELCDASDLDHQLLISPLCDSTKRGLSDMACLLGYINHGGNATDILLSSCAAVIHFPPFITSMKRIMEQNKIIGRDIATVCSTLFTFIRSYLPKAYPDDQVFEYLLQMCNVISECRTSTTDIPIMNIEVNAASPESPDKKLLCDLKLGPIVYFWRVDIGHEFKFIDLDIQSDEIIEKANNHISLFTPVAPLSVLNCSIVRGKDYEYLYLLQNFFNESKSYSKIYIIDPFLGMEEISDIEEFAKNKRTDKNCYNVADFIDPDIIDQIIMVNLDESLSMTNDIFGLRVKQKSNKISRVMIANQYLETFFDRIYGNHIQTIQGLVSFNDKVTIRSPLTPFISNFMKGLNTIKPYATTRLYDSIELSCNEIYKFRKDIHGNEIYKNAISRILIISDGEDVGSSSKVEDIVKELIRNNIIVDSIFINSEEDFKMITAICHATGGIAYKVTDVNDGISLIEKSAFFNIRKRTLYSQPLIKGEPKTIPSYIKPEQITEEFMQSVSNCAKLDSDVQNKQLILASKNLNLATPRHVMAIYQSKKTEFSRIRRILKELHLAAKTMDLDNINYDPDMKIFVPQSNLDIWRVFILGPKEGFYEGRWWYLQVTFPDLYPVQSPNIKFITVPYHINFSSDGEICMNIIGKYYKSSQHIIDIIQEIKEMLILADSISPIRFDAYDLFLNQPEEYKKRAQYSRMNAKDDYKEYIITSVVKDDVPTDFNINFDDMTPHFLISQTSGKEKEKI